MAPNPPTRADSPSDSGVFSILCKAAAGNDDKERETATCFPQSGVLGLSSTFHVDADGDQHRLMSNDSVVQNPLIARVKNQDKSHPADVGQTSTAIHPTPCW